MPSLSPTRQAEADQRSDSRRCGQGGRRPTFHEMTGIAEADLVQRLAGPVQGPAEAAHSFPEPVAERAHKLLQPANCALRPIRALMKLVRAGCHSLAPDAQDEQNHDQEERHAEKPHDNEFHGRLLRYLTPPDGATSRVR
jgi:hypothetical protein